MRFAIVDDDKNMTFHITEILKKLLSNKKVEADVFTESSAFLNNYSKKKYSAFFLDIDMPEPNGFKLAEILRDNKSNIPIIYVTGRDELVINAFRYKPLGFVRIYDDDFAEIQNGQREIFDALTSVLKYFVRARS